MRRAILLPGLLILLLPLQAQAADPPAIELAAMPPSPLRASIARLPAATQAAALAKLAQDPGLLNDASSVRADHNGAFYYVCPKAAPAAARAASRALPARPVGRAAVPIATPPAYHSRAGAEKVIYLDFNGRSVTGTLWNSEEGVDTFEALPLDLDNDPTTFSDAEQTFIQHVWQRVAEDYAPFDVDVTTEEPAVIDQSTALALITYAQDANSVTCPAGDVAGGVAYLNVFGTGSYVSTYQPAWIYIDNLSDQEDYVAEATAHEIGHNMGLKHDGQTGTPPVGYYGGHGTGLATWGPIMGTGYDQNYSQWSKGEYTKANNKEDDLAIIAGKLTYRSADHGATIATAEALVTAAGAVTADPANSGVIERTGVKDVFLVSSGVGTISLTVTPFICAENTLGCNLFVQAELLDSTGAVLASATPNTVGINPAVTVSYVVAGAAAGAYYLRVSGVGNGNVATTGFSSYGSLGQYTVTGTVPTNPPGTIGLVSATQSVTEGNSGTKYIDVVLQRTVGSGGTVSVNLATADGTATAAGLDYTAVDTTVVWDDTDKADKTVRIPILGDTTNEADETFTVTLSGAIGGPTMGTTSETITILNDDAVPPTAGSIQLATYLASVDELTGTVSFTVNRVGSSVSGDVGVHWATASGTAAAGTDFTASSGDFTWIGSDQTPRTITVPILNDQIPEADETFTIKLSAPTGGAILPTPSTATVTILNDDAGVGFSSATISALEPATGSAPTPVVVQRLGAAHGSIHIDYTTVDGTAVQPGDYTTSSGTLTWNDGDSSSRVIPVTIFANAIADDVRSFQVQLSNVGGSGAESYSLGNHDAATVDITDRGLSGKGSNGSATNGSLSGKCGAGAVGLLLAGAMAVLALRRRRR